MHVHLVGDNPYPCSICGFRALTRDGLQSHKAKEHEKMSFPCKECSFTANSRSQLWNHSLVHSGFGEDMGIECPECQQKIGRYRTTEVKSLRILIQCESSNSISEEVWLYFYHL